MHLASRSALHPGQLFQRLAELCPQRVHIHSGGRQQRPHAAALLVEQRQKQMNRFDIVVIAPDRERLGIGQRHLKLVGQFVHSHMAIPRKFDWAVPPSFCQRRWGP